MKNPITEPTAEEMKQLAEWGWPDCRIEDCVGFNKGKFDFFNIKKGKYVLTNLDIVKDIKARIHLQDRYREFLLKGNYDGCSTSSGDYVMHRKFHNACESSSSLIAAIVRDVIGGK